MSVLKSVRDLLIADATVSGLVAQRIYPLQAPQGVAAPFVVLAIATDVPESSHDGVGGDRMVTSRLQVDCYSQTYAEARRLFDAVDAVIAGLISSDLSALREGARDLRDDETQLFRVNADFAVFT